MASQYKLVYFEYRGNGELVRLLFAASNTKFTDERITYEQFGKIKADLPHQALPILTINKNGTEKTLCQSGAIARYLAKQFKIGGSDDFEQFQIDEVMGCLQDVTQEFGTLFMEEDPKKKEQIKKNMSEKSLPKLIKYLNQRLKQQTGFFVGSKMTLADIAVFDFIDMQKSAGETCFDTEKEIMKVYDKVKANPGIADWLKNRPATAY